MKKMHFRGKMGVRVKIILKIVFETINFIYPENLGLLGLFLSKIEYEYEFIPNTTKLRI